MMTETHVDVEEVIRELDAEVSRLRRCVRGAWRQFGSDLCSPGRKILLDAERAVDRLERQVVALTWTGPHHKLKLVIEDRYER